jgi:hypothetical protein
MLASAQASLEFLTEATLQQKKRQSATVQLNSDIFMSMSIPDILDSAWQGLRETCFKSMGRTKDPHLQELEDFTKGQQQLSRGENQESGLNSGEWKQGFSPDVGCGDEKIDVDVSFCVTFR